MQKQIPPWLIVAILIFAISASVACGHRDGSTTNVADAPISFCDLVRKPDAYNSKTVHVRGILVGYHETALYDPTCDPNVKYIRADFDGPSRRKLVDGIVALGGAGVQRGNFWAGVILAGRFERMPAADCQKNSVESGMPERRYVNYCYQLVVSEVSQVSAVPAKVEWPK